MRKYHLVIACGLLAACTPNAPVAKINSDNAAVIVRSAVGTAIIGAEGKTPKDQAAIDETVAGPCAIGAFTPSECSRHNKKQ